MTAEEKRQLRLARNREAARMSRKKKKQQMELHEEKVAELTKELDHLRRLKFEVRGCWPSFAPLLFTWCLCLTRRQRVS